MSPGREVCKARQESGPQKQSGVDKDSTVDQALEEGRSARLRAE